MQVCYVVLSVGHGQVVLSVNSQEPFTAMKRRTFDALERHLM